MDAPQNIHLVFNYESANESRFLFPGTAVIHRQPPWTVIKRSITTNGNYESWIISHHHESLLTSIVDHYSITWPIVWCLMMVNHWLIYIKKRWRWVLCIDLTILHYIFNHHHQPSSPTIITNHSFQHRIITTGCFLEPLAFPVDSDASNLEAQAMDGSRLGHQQGEPMHGWVVVGSKVLFLTCRFQTCCLLGDLPCFWTTFQFQKTTWILNACNVRNPTMHHDDLGLKQSSLIEVLSAAKETMASSMLIPKPLTWLIVWYW